MQRKIGFLIAVALPLLGACSGNSAPTGQVVARVNGEEVTVAELNHEAQSRGVTNAADPQAKQQLLQAIIDRKLLAQSAVEKKVDRNPEYLVMRKRTDELMLSNLFVRKSIVEGTQEPSRADVEAFANSRPTMFDGRVILAIDQITAPRPGDQRVMSQLAAAKSLDEIDRSLAAAGLPRERTRVTWDSARMPPELAQRLLSLPPGEPFIQTSDPMLAGVIVDRRAAPVPPEGRIAFATEQLKQQRVRESAQNWLQGQRRNAKIQYQQGYAPPKPSGQPKEVPAGPQSKS
jgi:EpsD family peptidyl-prolyl cis-trans isomerase